MYVTPTAPLSADSPLVQPVRAGALAARNRVWMAPMTRNRADPDGTPNDLVVEYYRQRAGAGVVITEGTQPSATGQGYPRSAGLVTGVNEAGWTRVADAVHAGGGTVVAQLMHAGRIAHTSATGGATPVSSTAHPAHGEIFTDAGRQPYSTPRALGADELPGVAAEFADAARRARRAGVDGVELHAANGYLLHQFLSDGANDRTDAYGGSAENRARFVVEVARATADAIGADRVGIRISPLNPVNHSEESDVSVYEPLVGRLAELDLAYLHLLAEPDDPILGTLRALWPGTFVLNTGFAVESERDGVERLVADGLADAVTVGRPFIANPDLVERWTRGAPLNAVDESIVYGGGPEGYTDYPALR